MDLAIGNDGAEGHEKVHNLSRLQPADRCLQRYDC